MLLFGTASGLLFSFYKDHKRCRSCVKVFYFSRRDYRSDKQSALVPYHCVVSDWTKLELRQGNFKVKKKIRRKEKSLKAFWLLKRKQQQTYSSNWQSFCWLNYSAVSDFVCSRIKLQLSMLNTSEKCHLWKYISFIWQIRLHWTPKFHFFNSSSVLKVVVAHVVPTVVVCTQKLNFWLHAQLSCYAIHVSSWEKQS